MSEVTRTILQAVEATEAELGAYANPLEGYGDMCRQLIGLQEEAKELKKQCGEVVYHLDDGQELANRLRTVEVQAQRLIHAAVGMCAKLRRFASAALPYGDLLTMLEGMDDDQDQV